jgi:hypothetical protein
MSALAALAALIGIFEFGAFDAPKATLSEVISRWNED